MRLRSFALLLSVAGFSANLFSQGLETAQTKEHWEEINFEFNSAVLSDGYPSLLRLADLLKQHADYRVRLEGNTDSVGSHKYNDKLSVKRASTVKDFLVKYGAPPDRIEVAGQGKRRPEVSNQSKEGRFMNRRVVLTVTDGQGRTVSAAGVGEAIAAIQMTAPAAPACCDDLLKKLDKLDEILAMLKDLKAENERLRGDVDALKNAQSATERQVEALPKPVTQEEVEKVVKKEADQAVKKSKSNPFTLLGLNGGPDDQGHGTFTGKGRFFLPLGASGTHAFQAEAEYMHWYDRSEGQFDFGLVNRFQSVQLGLFSSFKHVDMRQYASGGTLGEAAVTLDWLFGRGRLGVFGTKGFLDEPVLGSTQISPDFAMQTYLKLVDQVGVSASVGLFRRNYLEANLGYLKSPGHVDRPGGTARFIFPMNKRIAFTVEGGLNETLLTVNNSGRVAFGIQLGNWLEPRKYKAMGTAVPVDIPRVRYDLLTRRVRTGIGIPVADAGPNQIGVPAGSITLNGSGSHDPDGEPLTFQWSQISGPPAALSSPNAAITTFPAAAGANYAFRLVVKNPEGGQGSASVTVTTRATPAAVIVQFTANPASIQPGGTTLVSWQVRNADTVTLNGTPVNAQSGTSTFAPTQTTAYTLVAKNSVGQVSQTVTVTVTAPAPAPAPAILVFQARPANIKAGESAALIWVTQNAAQVTISPNIGAVALNGSHTVSPTSTTSYTLTASNPAGQTTATATVTVAAAPVPVVQPPRVLVFQARPASITAGASSTLTWVTENATQVTISGVGTVAADGTRAVSPQATTTYTLAASNSAGQATATATVTVATGAAPTIVGFAANPAQITAGQTSTLTWQVNNADTVTIDNGIGTVAATGTSGIKPAATTTYTLTAVNKFGQATASATCTVTPGPAPPPSSGKAKVIEFIATPTYSSAPGADVILQWQTVNAVAVSISGLSIPLPVTGATTLRPAATTTYTLTATDSSGNTATASVTVTVPGPSNTPAAGKPPVANAGASFQATVNVVYLDGSHSYDPAGGALTYSWTALTPGASVVNPTLVSPTAVLGTTPGDYVFSLKVTNSAGVSATSTVTVTLVTGA